MWSVSGRVVAGMLVACALALTPAPAFAQGPREQYTKALARERELRDGERPPTARQIREVVAAYEGVVRRYPTSGYSDNALWQASELSRLAWDRFGEESDKRTGVRLLRQLEAGYPASSLISGVDQAVANFDTTKAIRRTNGEVSRDMVYATGIASSTAITALISARRRVSECGRWALMAAYRSDSRCHARCGSA